MRISTMLNRRAEFEMQISDLYRRAAAFSWHCDKINDEARVFWEDVGRLKRFPGHAKQYLRGYSCALWKKHWELMDWVFPWHCQIYRSWAGLPDDAREYYKLPGNTGFHVYKSNNHKVFTGNEIIFRRLFDGDPVNQPTEDEV